MKKSLCMMMGCGIQLLVPQLAYSHASLINNKAWQVCEIQARSDACEYTDNHDNIYRGSCQLMSEKLLCVRNQPIERADPDAAKH